MEDILRSIYNQPFKLKCLFFICVSVLLKRLYVGTKVFE